MTKITIDRDVVEQTLKLLNSAHVSTALVWPRYDVTEKLRAALHQMGRINIEPWQNRSCAKDERQDELMQSEIDELREALSRTEQVTVPPVERDTIAVNFMRLAGLDKHKARECADIVQQIYSAPQPPQAPEWEPPNALEKMDIEMGMREVKK